MKTTYTVQQDEALWTIDHFFLYFHNLKKRQLIGSIIYNFRHVNTKIIRTNYKYKPELGAIYTFLSTCLNKIIRSRIKINTLTNYYFLFMVYIDKILFLSNKKLIFEIPQSHKIST